MNKVVLKANMWTIARFNYLLEVVYSVSSTPPLVLREGNRGDGALRESASIFLRKNAVILLLLPFGNGPL